MPRPKRFAEREAAIAAGVKVAERDPPAASPSDTDNLDAGQNVSQPLRRTGAILPEAGDAAVYEPVARTFGWVPREEWTRDPSQWTDAKAFLEDQPRRLADMKSRIRTLGQVTERQMEEERRKAREEAERAVRDAAASQDPDRAVQAAERLAQAAGPPPETQAWLSRNPWFHNDPAAQALARTVVDREVKAGRTYSEQLAAAEAEVRKRFPEHFGGAPPDLGEPRGETRLSDLARREPPQMAEGQRGGSSRRADKAKGWAEIPSLDREAMKPFFKRFRSRGWEDPKIQAELAASYWANKGE